MPCTVQHCASHAVPAHRALAHRVHPRVRCSLCRHERHHRSRPTVDATARRARLTPAVRNHCHDHHHGPRGLDHARTPTSPRARGRRAPGSCGSRDRASRTRDAALSSADAASAMTIERMPRSPRASGSYRPQALGGAVTTGTESYAQCAPWAYMPVAQPENQIARSTSSVGADARSVATISL